MYQRTDYQQLGYYVRTELKYRFKAIDSGNARYSIPCPITELAMDLYDSAHTGIESEAEIVAEAIVIGINVPEWSDGVQRNRNIGGGEYIRKIEFNLVCRHLGLKTARSYNDYFKKLQDMKVLDYREERDKNSRFGYKIIRDKKFYGENAVSRWLMF